MSRLVDADALKERFQSLAYDDWNQGVNTSWADAYRECADMVDEMPTIESECKTGQWIEYIPEHGKCPFCGNLVDLMNGKENNYCGECGADLRGVKHAVN